MKISLQKFIVFGVFIVAALGCSAINKIQKVVEQTQQPKVINSTDGSYQITVPGMWQVETTLNPQATLQASNRIGELYVIIIRENKQDFGKNANLNVITDAIRENLKKALTNPVLSESTPATVSGNQALQFDADGEVQNMKLKYLYAVVETPQNYYQIITWTLASRYQDNRPQLIDVINSFKENSPGNAPPSVAGSNSGKPK